MGMDKDFGLAFSKSQIAAGNSLPTKGLAFISLKDKHKNEGINLAKKLVELNFSLCGTPGAVVWRGQPAEVPAPYLVLADRALASSPRWLVSSGH